MASPISTPSPEAGAAPRSIPITPPIAYLSIGTLPDKIPSMIPINTPACGAGRLSPSPNPPVPPSPEIQRT